MAYVWDTSWLCLWDFSDYNTHRVHGGHQALWSWQSVGSVMFFCSHFFWFFFVCVWFISHFHVLLVYMNILIQVQFWFSVVSFAAFVFLRKMIFLLVNIFVYFLFKILLIYSFSFAEPWKCYWELKHGVQFQPACRLFHLIRVTIESNPVLSTTYLVLFSFGRKLEFEKKISIFVGNHWLELQWIYKSC